MLKISIPLQSIQLEFKSKSDYLYLTINGEYNKEDFILLPAIVAEESKKENIRKVLINALELNGTDVPIMDRFFIGEETAKVIGNRIKVAVIWPEKDITKFAETVAINRGGFLYVFGNISEGEEWLLADQ